MPPPPSPSSSVAASASREQTCTPLPLPPLRPLLLLLLALPWHADGTVLCTPPSSSLPWPRRRPPTAAFVRPATHAAPQRQHTRLHGRKKNPPRGGSHHHNNADECPSRTPAGSKTTSFSPAAAAAATAAASSTITSLIGRSDKVEVLRTIESLPTQFLTGATLTAAWDRLAQRTVSAGPRAPHLPPLHTDRAFLLLLERTRDLLRELSPGHCASIVGNMAKLRYRPDDDFLATVLASCRARADLQSFGQAARLASGLARLDYDFQDQELAKLAGLMHDRMVSMDLSTLHPESLSMGLWALSVLGALQHPDRNDLRERLVGAAISRLSAAHEEATAPGHGQGPVLSEGKAKNLVRICRQLRTSLLFLPPSPPHDDDIPSAQEELGLRVEQVWLDLGAWLDPVRPSRLQMEVETTLRLGGAQFAVEWEDGVVTVDIALHPRPPPPGPQEKNGGLKTYLKRPVALEVDGPSHFFVNQPQRPTGDTKIKHQALHMRNQWSAVISLPHFEWPKHEKQRLPLIQRKLAGTGLEPRDFLEV